MQSARVGPARGGIAADAVVMLAADHFSRCGRVILHRSRSGGAGEGNTNESGRRVGNGSARIAWITSSGFGPAADATCFAARRRCRKSERRSGRARCPYYLSGGGEHGQSRVAAAGHVAIGIAARVGQSVAGVVQSVADLCGHRARPTEVVGTAGLDAVARVAVVAVGINRAAGSCSMDRAAAQAGVRAERVRRRRARVLR